MVCFHWVCVLITLTFTCTTATYKDFKLIDLNLDEKQKSNINHILNQLVEDYGVDRLSENKIMIEAQYYSVVTEMLNMEGISFELVSDDVEEFLKKRGYASSTVKRRKRRKRSHKNEITCEGYTKDDLFSDKSNQTLENIVYKQFLQYCPIVTWLKEMAKKYDNVMKVEEIGKSHEGRSMMLAKINDGDDREVVVIEGGTHAREWAGITTGLTFIEKLVRAMKGNNDCVYNRYAFYIIPVMNPDGYEYTFEERLWRKTRSPTDSDECIGTDMNRNFDAFYDACRRRGTPRDIPAPTSNLAQCRDVYPGSAAESEIETKNIVKFLNTLKGRVKLSFSLHSYGNIWILPYTHTDLPTAPNYDNMFKVGKVAKENIYHNHLISFRIGTTHDILRYKACGSFMDWMVEKMEVPYAYTLELMPEADYFEMTIDNIEVYTEVFSTAMESVLTEVRKIENPDEQSGRTLVYITKHDGYETENIHLNATACRNILDRQTTQNDHSYPVHVVNSDDSLG